MDRFKRSLIGYYNYYCITDNTQSVNNFKDKIGYLLLSNIYLHYVLDLWFEKAIKPRLKGESYLIRYIDDFVVCFQYRSDAIRFGKVLVKRLRKYSLELEPNKTRLAFL
ncbi:reverse transcriptase domain-containing protein [Bacillus sp. ISL-40]|nr:reverse transcriptase domain-containing protein [Bacillus sp. ISL-40]